MGQRLQDLISSLRQSREQNKQQRTMVWWLLGVLDSIYIDDSDSKHMNMVGLNEDKIVH